MIKRRNFNKSNIDYFYNALFTTNWEDMVKGECPSEAYTLFVNKCITLLDEHIPEQISNYIDTNFKKHPWITQAILKSIRTRHHLSKSLIRSKATANINNDDQQYKQFRNILNRVRRNAKSQYWNNQFTESKNNMKQTCLLHVIFSFLH